MEKIIPFEQTLKAFLGSDDFQEGVILWLPTVPDDEVILADPSDENLQAGFLAAEEELKEELKQDMHDILAMSES